jgi:hypothetical protein
MLYTTAAEALGKPASPRLITVKCAPVANNVVAPKLAGGPVQDWILANNFYLPQACEAIIPLGSGHRYRAVSPKQGQFVQNVTAAMPHAGILAAVDHVSNGLPRSTDISREGTMNWMHPWPRPQWMFFVLA